MVQLDTGEQVTIHNEPLVAQIRAQAVTGTARAEKLSALRQRLQALVAALATAPPPASGDDDAKLRDLLSKPPFQQEAQAPNELLRLLDELLSRLFGVRLPLNFASPYKATSMIEFWRRWHITLSRFLRDYLYFPPLHSIGKPGKDGAVRQFKLQLSKRLL